MTALSDYFYKGPVIQLNCGREISLQGIEQWLTYAHILEGFPWNPYFKGTVRLHLDWAKERHPNRKIIVLEPRLRPLGIPEGDLERMKLAWKHAEELKSRSRQGIKLTFDEVCQSDYPEPVCIGNVCCTALFDSTPIDDVNFMGSELFVIWFQDGFAMPIDPLVVEQMKVIDWENEAVDYNL
jgi:hypothetical protein